WKELKSRACFSGADTESQENVTRQSARHSRHRNVYALHTNVKEYHHDQRHQLGLTSPVRLGRAAMSSPPAPTPCRPGDPGVIRGFTQLRHPEWTLQSAPRATS